MEENKLKLLMGKCKPGEYEDCFGIPLWENTLKISHMGLRHLLYMEIFLKGSYSYRDRELGLFYDWKYVLLSYIMRNFQVNPWGYWGSGGEAPRENFTVFDHVKHRKRCCRMSKNSEKYIPYGKIVSSILGLWEKIRPTTPPPRGGIKVLWLEVQIFP